MESSSLSGSSKRAKAPANNVTSPIANCMVDGCNADLSLCRDYHRRHKVCEAHSKTSRVTIGGREQRFCQQCSRFHSLGEFDEGKRSCRKRLDGHNRRRRKSQMDPIPRTGLIFSTQPAPSSSRLLSFSTPQLLPNSAISSSWTTNLIKPQNNIAIYNHPQYPNYSDQQQTSMFPESSTYKGGIVNQQLSFMQRNIPPSHPILDSDKIFCDGLNQVVDSDRALSLLSSSAPSVTREFIMNQQQLPQASSLVNDLQYSTTNNATGLGQFNPFGQESKPITSVTDSRGSDVSTMHFPGMHHHHQVNEGSSTSGTHQTLSFMWE